MGIRASLWFGLSALVGLVPGAAAQTMRGYENDLASPARIEDIDLSSGATTPPPDFALCGAHSPDPVNALFGSGFVSGLAYRGTRLYGLAWSAHESSDGEAASHAIDLVEIVQKPLCAGSVSVGRIVDPQGRALQNLEGLAYSPRDGLFYSVDYDLEQRRGRVVRVDPETARATPVDPSQHLPAEHKVQGLTCCDPSGDLYAVTSGFAGLSSPQLLRLGRRDGRATAIGPTGTAPSTPLRPLLESLELDRSASPPRLFAAGEGLFEIDPTTGWATRVAANDSDALWGIAMTVPEPAGSAPPALALAVLGSLSIGRRRAAR